MAASVDPTPVHRRLRLYLDRQASNLGRYALEQTLYAVVGWVPTILGLGLRAVLYRLILHMDGWAGIEHGVRLRFADHIRLGAGPYLDQGVYLHACPARIETVAGTIVMHGANSHKHSYHVILLAGIRIGRDSL